MSQKIVTSTLAFFLIWLCLTSDVQAQSATETTITLTADPATITIGDVAALTLEVTHPAGYRVLVPTLGPTWGDFEIRSQSAPQITQLDNGRERTTQTINVTLWQVGEFTTLPLPLTISNRRGELIKVTADSVTLTVVSVLAEDDLALRDIKPQATLPFPSRWPWLLLGLSAVTIAAAFLWQQWQQQRTAVKPFTDNRPPYQIALDELDNITALNLPQQGQFKQHYTLISDVLRHYLDATYGTATIDQTTAEIQRVLHTLSIPLAQKTALVQMLQEADLVKFANLVPDKQAAQHLSTQARHFVTATQPQPSQITTTPS